MCFSLRALVDNYDRAPPAAAVRTPLTPIGARFIKRAYAVKNERFDSTRRMQGKPLLAGSGAQPAPICSMALRGPFRRFDRKCVRKRTAESRLLTNSCSSSETAYVI
jgi:hypothetical protein